MSFLTASRETGLGHTSEQVKSYKSPPTGVILEYYRAVMKKVKSYIDTKLDEKEIFREYYSPTFKRTSKVIDTIAGLSWHGGNHIGQAGYVRGLLKGKGWYGR